MLSAAVISLALVAFAIVVRKEHLEARFKLTAANEKLAKVSLQDPLTGAWNRRFLDEHFGEIVARYTAGDVGWALGVVDVDEFKELNDSYGHACGDRVLQRLVKALTETLDADEYVVRIGGDVAPRTRARKVRGTRRRLPRSAGDAEREHRDGARADRSPDPAEGGVPARRQVLVCRQSRGAGPGGRVRPRRGGRMRDALRQMF